MVEQVAVNDKVRGSSPLGGAKFSTFPCSPPTGGQEAVNFKVRGSNPRGGAELSILEPCDLPLRLERLV